jgi:hypothetical protein
MNAAPAATISIFTSSPPGYGSTLPVMCYTLFSNMLNICYIWELTVFNTKKKTRGTAAPVSLIVASD